MKPIRKIAALSVILFGSCNLVTRSVDDNYFFENFDNLRTWYPDSKLSNEVAYSGTYSAYVDSTTEYSQTFRMDLRQIRYMNYKRVKVSAWCYKKTADTQASLALAIEDTEKRIGGTNIDLSKKLPVAGNWGKVSATLEFPDKTPEVTFFKIYLYSPTRQTAYMDDLEVQFYR